MSRYVMEIVVKTIDLDNNEAVIDEQQLTSSEALVYHPR